MKILAATVGEFQENTYLVIDEATGRAVVVDPGAEPDRVVKWIRASGGGATLDAVWLTHAHLDHVGAVAGVTRAWPVPVYMHPADTPTLARAPQAAVAIRCGVRDAVGAGQRARRRRLALRRWADVFGDARAWSRARARRLSWKRVVLGGDLLFAGSIGRTDLPLADPRAMEESLARICELDDDFVVYPGHGPATTIGRERATNPFLLDVARSGRR